MNMNGEFVPLSLLIRSLESNQKLYFLYRKAAETGTPGARLRFHWFKLSLDREENHKLDLLFGSSNIKKRSA